MLMTTEKMPEWLVELESLKGSLPGLTTFGELLDKLIEQGLGNQTAYALTRWYAKAEDLLALTQRLLAEKNKDQSVAEGLSGRFAVCPVAYVGTPDGIHRNEPVNLGQVVTVSEFEFSPNYPNYWALRFRFNLNSNDHGIIWRFESARQRTQVWTALMEQGFNRAGNAS